LLEGFRHSDPARLEIIKDIDPAACGRRRLAAAQSERLEQCVETAADGWVGEPECALDFFDVASRPQEEDQKLVLLSCEFREQGDIEVSLKRGTARLTLQPDSFQIASTD
jgi:hypothetical protein